MKKNQSKLENSIAKMITDLKAMKSRLNNAEEKVSDLKDKMIKITVVQTFLKQYSILEDDRTIPIKFSRKVCPNICISSYIAF